MNPEAYFIQYIKMNSKWILHLNVTGKMIKVAEKNIGEYNNDFEVRQRFLKQDIKSTYQKKIIR